MLKSVISRPSFSQIYFADLVMDPIRQSLVLALFVTEKDRSKREYIITFDQYQTYLYAASDDLMIQLGMESMEFLQLKSLVAEVSNISSTLFASSQKGNRWFLTQLGNGYTALISAADIDLETSLIDKRDSL